MGSANTTALNQMSDAAAHAISHFANRNFDESSLLDPVAAVTGDGAGDNGGGLHLEDREFAK